MLRRSSPNSRRRRWSWSKGRCIRSWRGRRMRACSLTGGKSPRRDRPASTIPLRTRGGSTWLRWMKRGRNW
jgi:Transcriptional regulator PadR-like family